MSRVLPGWMYADPALVMDRYRLLHRQMEATEEKQKERLRRHKARRIRALVRLAKAKAGKPNHGGFA